MNRELMRCLIDKWKIVTNPLESKAIIIYEFILYTEEKAIRNISVGML